MESSTACPVCTLYLREGISLYDHLDTHPKDQVIEALIRIRERDEPIAPTPPQPLLSIPTSQSAPYYQSPQPCYPVQQYSTNSYAYQQMAMMGTSPHLGPVAMVMPPSAPTPSLMQVMYNPYMLSGQPNIQLMSPSNPPPSAASSPDHLALLPPPKPAELAQSSAFEIATPEPRKRQSPPPTSGFVPPPAQVVRPVPTYDESRVDFRDEDAELPSRSEEPEPSARVRFVQYKLSSERIARASRETSDSSAWQTTHFAPTLRELADVAVATAPARSKRARTRAPRTRVKPSATETASRPDAEFYASRPGGSRLQPIAAEESGDEPIACEEQSRLEPMACVDDRGEVKTDQSDDENDAKREVDPLMSRDPEYDEPGPAGPLRQVGDPAFRRLSAQDPEDQVFRRHSAHEEEDPVFRRHSTHEEEDPVFRRHSVHEEEDPVFRRVSVHEEEEDLSFRRLAPEETAFSRRETGDPAFQRLESEKPTYQRLETGDPSFQRLNSEESSFQRLESEESAFQRLESEDLSFRKSVDTSFRRHEDDNPAIDRLQSSDDSFRRRETGEPTFQRLDTEGSAFERPDPAFGRRETDEPVYERLGPDAAAFGSHESREADFRRLSVHEAEDPLEVRTAVDSIIMPGNDDEYITSDCAFPEAKDGDCEPPGGAEFVSRFVGEFRTARDVDVSAYPEPAQGSELYPTHTTLEAGIKPKVLKQQIDDLNVSTSYEVLAREGWAVSDGSDTEAVTARIPPPFVAVAEKRAYKCAQCGESFACPKERRVHRTEFHPKPKPEETAVAQTAETPLKTERVRPPRAPRKKRVVKAVQVLVVQNADEFTGVFVKEDATDPLAEIKKEEAAVAGGSKAVRGARNGPYSCTACPLQFTLRRKYLLHVAKEHKNSMSLKNPYICNICQEVFTNDRTYSEHLQKHPLECKTCCKVFHRRQNLVLHMRRHLGIKPYPCNMCTKSFITKQKLTEHRNVHLGLAPIKCTLCTMAFRRYSNLIQHKNRFHYMIKKKVKDYVCFCGEIFHSKKKLEWHKEIHEKKPKCCKFCSERFVHTASLTRHIRRSHDRRYMPKVGRETENVECGVCGHVFLKSSLPVHMRLHTGERPYSCSVCGKTFTTKWNLQQHRWTHMSRSSKPFKCGQCKAAFARETDYSQHMDSHSNKRPYTCNICGLQFVRKNNCIRHAKEHQAAKTFTCKVCNKSFHRGYYLKDHMMVHSGARPFTCHICGKASSTKSNHNKHVKIHHAREPVNTEA